MNKIIGSYMVPGEQVVTTVVKHGFFEPYLIGFWYSMEPKMRYEWHVCRDYDGDGWLMRETRCDDGCDAPSHYFTYYASQGEAERAAGLAFDAIEAANLFRLVEAQILDDVMREEAN